MKTSVALCTYNGAKYIEEQLTSIISQTRRVDEIVLCDDGSTDDTLKIVEQLAQTSSMPIRVLRNAKNLGFYKNFVKAISLCTGDVIFLCDQDDVWREDKVEKIIQWFNTNPYKDVVFTNAQLIDNTGCVFTSETLWDRVGFAPKMQRYFNKGYEQEIFSIANRATGATMALRKRFVDGKKLTVYGFQYHDYCIAYMAAVERCLGYITESLIGYRIHNENTLGLGYFKLFFYSPLRACTEEVWGVHNLPEKAQQRLNFMRKREKFYLRRLGILRIVGNFVSYIHYYGFWWYKFAAFDVCRCLKNSVKIHNCK